MSEGVTLCAGTLADLPGVMAVMDAAFEARFGEAWTASQCAGLLPMPGVWLTLARRADSAPPVVIGFALSRVVADEAELLLLAVHPDARRCGVGAALLREFETAAAARGAQRLHLEMRDGNDAVKLYETSGFTVTGRRRRYYNGTDGQVHDALSLARST